MLNIRYEYEPEVFVPITFFEGYSISNYGNIFSNKTNRILEGFIDKGYRKTDLYVDGKKIHVFNHILVAQYFVPNPNNYPIVNHEDGNPLNCYYKNLIWCTYYYNNIHKENVLKNANHKQQKLTDNDPLEIYRLAHEGDLTLKQIAEQFGVSEGFVSNIKNGRKYNDITHHIKSSPISFVTMEKENEIDYGNNKVYGEKSRNAKITSEQAREIYKLAHDGKLQLKQIGNMYNISGQNVADIRDKKAWKHATEDL